jgi:calcineurin-like phosphoesterase family protein
MSLYFTSDDDIGHAAARTFYRGPFASFAEVDRVVNRWNAVVEPGDQVLHLGDFAVCQSALRIASLLKVLNCRKHLVTGNNDDAAVTKCDGWRSVQPYAEVTVVGTQLVLCHYPFRTWRDMSRGAPALA